MGTEMLELSIQNRNCGWWLCGEGEYPRGSVLEGQYRFMLIKPYDSIESAMIDNPDVPVKDPSLPGWMFSGMSDVPPADFDPGYAGETW